MSAADAPPAPLTAAGWLDISVPLHNGMVTWPGDPPFQRHFAEEIERGDAANVSHLSLGAHTGTHMDAPLHFIPGAATLDQLPLEAVIGPARVLALRDRAAI